MGGFEGNFNSYLYEIGEPSLFATAKDTNNVSYRLVCWMCQTPNFLVLRISLNPDGSAAITIIRAAIDDSERPVVQTKTQRTVASSDVNRFLQTVDKADFWSMPAVEPENADPHLRLYKVHAGHWILEGVRNGSYHVMYRYGPEASSFTDMVLFLAKDIAKLNSPAIPHVSPPSQIKPAKVPHP